MLYIGLVVGAFLGICISIIVLVIIKDLVIRARSGEATFSAIDHQVSETSSSLFSSFPAVEEEEKLIGDVSR